MSRGLMHEKYEKSLERLAIPNFVNHNGFSLNILN